MRSPKAPWATGRVPRPLACVVGLLALVAVGGCSGDSPSAAGAGTVGSSGAGSDTTDDLRPLLLPDLAACDPNSAALETVRLTSWNMSAARLSSIDEVTATLADLDADVILLQEVDVGVTRTGNINQAAVVAERLGHAYGFAAAIEWDGGDFGLAILSRLPFESARRISLDPQDVQDAFEPRIAFDVTLCAGPTPVRFVDVHADFVTSANLRNLATLATEVGDLTGGKALIAGDLNADPDSAGVVDLIARTGTRDAFATRDAGPTRNQRRIDFMLATASIDDAVTHVMRVDSEASDHRALVLDFVP